MWLKENQHQDFERAMYSFLDQWVETMVDPELYSLDAPAEEFSPKM
jgi:hypothetical protein